MDISTLYIKVDSEGFLTASRDGEKYTRNMKDAAGATDGFNDKSKKGKHSLAEFSSGLKTVGRDLNRYSLLMAAAITSTVKFANDLSKGLGQVQTLIPNTGDRIYELEQVVKDLAVETGKSFGDLNEGLYQTISAFQDSADTVDIFTQATKASIAGASTVADAIALASAVTKAYGDTSKEATAKVFDLAFETVRLGQTTFPQLANAIQQATDSAVRLGVSQEELFASFATLTGVVGDASEVSTKFRSAAASLLNPNDKLRALFDQLAKATGEVITTGDDFVRVSGGWANALKLIIDTAVDSDEPFQDYIKRIEGISFASRISSNSLEKYKSDLKAMYEATGASERSFLEAVNGIDRFRVELDKLKMSFIVVAAEIGKTVLPKIIILGEFILGLVQTLSRLPQWIQDIGFSLTVLGGILGPTIILLGSFLRMWKEIAALNSVPLLGGLIGAGGALPVLLVTIAAVVAGLAIFNAAVSKSVAETNRINMLVAEQRKEYAQLPALIREWEKDQKNLNTVNYDHIVNSSNLLKIYPELARKVNLITASQEELVEAIRDVDEARARSDLRSLFADASKGVREYLAEVDKGKAQLDRIKEKEALIAQLREENTSKSIQRANIEERALQQLQGAMYGYARAITEAENNKDSLFDVLNDSLGAYGFEAFADFSTGWDIFLNDLFSMIETKGKDAPNIPDLLGGGGPDPNGKRLKTWEEWFQDVTDVSIDRFNQLKLLFDEKTGEVMVDSIKGSGKKAVEEWFKDINEANFEEIKLDEMLGLTPDKAGVLESSINDVKSKLLNLLAIKSTLIHGSEEFLLTDEAVKETEAKLKLMLDLMNRFKSQNVRDTFYQDEEALKSLNDSLGLTGNSYDELSDKLARLQKTYDEAYGQKDRNELFLAKLRDDMAKTREEMSRTFEGAKADVKSFDDVLQGKLYYSLLNTLNLAPQVALAISEIGASLANMGIDLVVDSMFELGKSLTDATAGSRSFVDALQDQLMAILKMLPTLFIQAGLQLIANGNVPVGLALIAAGLTSSFIAGLTEGAVEKAEGTTVNASGNIFEPTGLQKFAKGSAFTNKVVDTPTYFKFASGTGLMGEAGPEAIMPLTRTSSGNLGVEAVGAGGNTNVTVNVINNSSAEVSTREKSTPNGKEIEVLINNVVQSNMANGSYDKTMNNRYGTKVRGYNN